MGEREKAPERMRDQNKTDEEMESVVRRKKVN
jgi:hypothetical protein